MQCFGNLQQISHVSDGRGEEFAGGVLVFSQILFTLAEQNLGNDFPRRPWSVGTFRFICYTYADVKAERTKKFDMAVPIRSVALSLRLRGIMSSADHNSFLKEEPNTTTINFRFISIYVTE